MSGVMSVGDDTRSAWLNRVLGFSLPAAPAPMLSIRFGAAPLVSGSTAPPPLLGSSRGRASATPVKPALGLARPQTINAGGGRELEIRKGRDGRVAFKAPSPPVGEITFSGGGGKGAALPGAVDELQDTLKDVKVVKGASVGSMTAALVAAGISKEDFKSAANDPQTTKRILEGRMGGKSALVKGLGGAQVSGTGMQSVIREQMSKAASKQIDALLARIDKEHDESLERGEDDSASESSDDTGGPSPARASAIDPALLVEIKKIREKIKDPNVGLTFKDLRTLSQAIPEIKEVEISASMVGDIIETAPNGTAPPPGKKKDPKMSAEKPQLAMFNADTQPDMEVALAARASAALPPVFAPVEIELAQGFKGKFIDGGVLNNAPNAKSIQSERDVDPMPPSSAMTFIFEDPDGEDRDILAGKAKPVSKGSADKLTGAPHSAAEYARVRSLADNPEDVVVVPLTFKNAKGKKKDFSTLLGGTVNFDISDKNKKVLQKMTADATAAHIEKSRQPKTREFDSDGQMFMCLSTSDLAALEKSGYAGAKAAVTFRAEALEAIADLIKAQSMDGGSDKTKQETDLLGKLEAAAGTDLDRQGFVAREMSRSGRLDGLMKRLAKGGSTLEVLKAGNAVVDALEAKAHAQTILREAIYPKMIKESPKKPKGMVLKIVDDQLRSARSPADVNKALDLAIATFGKTSKGKSKKSRFADECRSYKMAA